MVFAHHQGPLHLDATECMITSKNMTFNCIQWHSMAKTAAISVRLPEDVKEALESAARDDVRSTASYVEKLIVLHLREKGYLRK